jgi:hypothetical protein
MPLPNRTRPAQAASEQAPTKKLFHRGDEGRRRIDAEIELQKQRNTRQPFRFRVAPGETKSIIVVDEKPDFFLYEHNMKNPRTGKWGMFIPCLKEVDNCPICEQVGESYYAMYLTVIDLSPFTTKSGETIEFSRKLLVVKPSQQKKFIRRYEKEGTLRGAAFDCSRDKDKESSIGGDIEFLEMVPEAELRQYTRSWTDKDGKKHVETCHEPFKYEELIEVPTVAALRALVGGEPTPGSKEYVARSLDDAGTEDGWDDDDASVPWEEETPETKTAAAMKDEDEEGDEDEEATPRVRRTRPAPVTSRAASAPVPRRRTRE